MERPGKVHFDLVSALARVGGDRPLFEDLVNVFVEESPRLLAEFSDCIARGDRDTFLRAAHTLKGRAAFFSAGTLEKLALRLETMGRHRGLAAIRQTLDAVAIEIDRLRSALAAARSAGS